MSGAATPLLDWRSDREPAAPRARKPRAPAPSVMGPFVDEPCARCGKAIGYIAHPEHWHQPRGVCWRCATAPNVYPCTEPVEP